LLASVDAEDLVATCARSTLHGVRKRLEEGVMEHAGMRITSAGLRVDEGDA
jgi:hypothetical protein